MSLKYTTMFAEQAREHDRHGDVLSTSSGVRSSASGLS